MKKIVLAVSILLVTVLAYAGISKSDIEDKVISSLRSIRSVSLQARTQIQGIKDDLININTQFSGQLDTGDNTVLSGYPVLINDALTSLNALITQIDTDFPSLQQ